MAAGTKLVLVFRDSDANNITLSYNYANAQVEASAVNALANGIITNGSIFSKIPTTVVSAKIVTTDEREITLA